MLGGASDSLQAPAIGLPDSAHGAGRSELRYLPIAHRGHTYLALIDPFGISTEELHGVSFSRHINEQRPIGMVGSKLKATADYSMQTYPTQKVRDVIAGT